MIKSALKSFPAFHLRSLFDADFNKQQRSTSSPLFIRACFFLKGLCAITLLILETNFLKSINLNVLRASGEKRYERN